MISDALLAKVERLLEACAGARLTLVVAESCTGGLIAACLTSIPDASRVVERAFVTYSDQAKIDLLGVPAGLIEAHGAVSEPVARAMAEGALARTPADLAVSVTGIAGPGGGTPGKPIGLVHLAAARRGGPTTHERHAFDGERTEVRVKSVVVALDMVERLVSRTSQ